MTATFTDSSVQSKTKKPEQINVSSEEAAKRTGLSAKTLERLAQAGERVGRFKVGSRVLFHLATLDEWFRARTTANQKNQETSI